MLLRDLMREGRPAFPPNWQDPHSGAEPLRDDPLRGVLVEVEWGRHNLSLELKNYWRGRRLSGRLLTDDATVLPRVHALLTASIPRHLDELIDMEIPPPEPQSTARSVELPPRPQLRPRPMVRARGIGAPRTISMRMWLFSWIRWFEKGS